MQQLLNTCADSFHLKHGDCVRGMRQMSPKSVDVVVTSPPYNLGKAYSTYNDSRDPVEFLEWCEEWGLEILRTLKEDGSFFLNVGASSANLFFPFEVAQVMAKQCGFELQNTIHWIKSITIDHEGEPYSSGHFKPLNSERLVNDCHEYVFHLTKTGKTKLDRLAIGVPYADKSNIARWGHTNGRDKRCRGNTWFIPYKTIHQRAKQRPHPATFPTELAVKCIRLHGRKGSVVMDPFMGIGHAAFASQQCSDLVSAFHGFDVDEEYIRVACEVLGCGYSPVIP